MKADLKTPQEIELMVENGTKLSAIMEQLINFTKVGTKLSEVETLAVKLMSEAGGKPGFAMVPGYHWATCINLNEGIVHGIPNDRKIKNGDLVTIDTGMFYKGFHSDMAKSFLVGNSPYQTDIDKFLTTGKKALELAIAQAKPGNRIGHISQTIQQTIESDGYSVSYELTGHGVGRTLHEYPQIPGILTVEIDQTPTIKSGMTLAIEVIYNMGEPDIITDESDGWTIRMADNSLAAVFEKSVGITDKGNVLITP